MTPAPVSVGLIGGGMMGRELAAAIGRWAALQDHPSTPRLEAVCDPNPAVLDWFRRVDSVRRLTPDYHELLADDRIEVVYIAVPHHLHERIYLDTIAAGKDFLGEKPFGIDLAAATRIVAALEATPGVFARCSSEMPFFPGAQLAFEIAAAGELGQLIEAHSSFLHSSDLDRAKPINWKRQVATCGEIGVMGDLGLHVVHLPLRLGWRPAAVAAVLQDLVPERPDGRGGTATCDTIDNATLLSLVPTVDGAFPLTFETKRIAPGQMNTWSFRALGMDGGVEFSTRHPKTVRRFTVAGRYQAWQTIEVGSQSVFPTVTGSIFEFGFSDAVLQMWAAFLAERAGQLDGRFGCATPAEAVDGHRLFASALRASRTAQLEPVPSAGPRGPGC